MGTSSQWGVAALSASLCHLDEVKIPAVFISLLSLSGEEIRAVDEQNLQRNVTTNSAVDHVISCQLHPEAVTTIPVTGFPL